MVTVLSIGGNPSLEYSLLPGFCMEITWHFSTQQLHVLWRQHIYSTYLALLYSMAICYTLPLSLLGSCNMFWYLASLVSIFIFWFTVFRSLSIRMQIFFNYFTSLKEMMAANPSSIAQGQPRRRYRSYQRTTWHPPHRMKHYFQKSLQFVITAVISQLS